MTQPILDSREFHLCYQPVFFGSRIHHYEALIRRKDGKSPSVFVPEMEETGQVMDLDLLVLSLALEDLRHNPHIRIAINVSLRSAASTMFQKQFFSQLKESGVEVYGRLSVEITETAWVNGVRALRVRSFLQELNKLSVTSYIDDYRGVVFDGWKLWVFSQASTVKIDRTLLLKGGWALFCATTFIRLNHKKIVVEGVENKQQERLVRFFGVRMIQGHLFGKPIPLNATIR